MFKGEECEISDDNETLRYKGKGGRCSFARSSFHVPLQIPEVYYETEILEAGETGQVGVGFTTKLPTEYDYQKINGSTNGIGFCCKTGEICKGKKTTFKSNVSKETPFVRQGDVIGCRLQYLRLEDNYYQVIQFSLNGKNIGLPQGSKAVHPLHPSVWMASSGCIVRMNLGKRDFQYELSLIHI